ASTTASIPTGELSDSTVSGSSIVSSADTSGDSGSPLVDPSTASLPEPGDSGGKGASEDPAAGGAPHAGTAKKGSPTTASRTNKRRMSRASWPEEDASVEPSGRKAKLREPLENGAFVSIKKGERP